MMTMTENALSRIDSTSKKSMLHRESLVWSAKHRQERKPDPVQGRNWRPAFPPTIEDDELLFETKILGDNSRETILLAKEGDAPREIGEQLEQQTHAVDLAEIRLPRRL